MLLFNPGNLVCSANAGDVIPHDQMMGAIGRHLRGDFGHICEADKISNDKALEHGGRILSAYRTHDNIEFWVITEADRSVTTVLLPEDY